MIENSNTLESNFLMPSVRGAGASLAAVGLASGNRFEFFLGIFAAVFANGGVQINTLNGGPTALQSLAKRPTAKLIKIVNTLSIGLQHNPRDASSFGFSLPMMISGQPLTTLVGGSLCAWTIRKAFQAGTERRKMHHEIQDTLAAYDAHRQQGPTASPT